MATSRLRLPFERTVDGQLFDRAVRHAIQLERYKNGLYERLVPDAREMLDEILAETRKDLARIRRHPARTLHDKRIRGITSNLIRKQRESLRRGYAATKKRATRELKDLAVTEAEWARSALRSSLPLTFDFALPGVTTLEAIVTLQPAHGKLISEWFAEQAASAQARIGAATRAGIAQGRGIESIVREIRKETDVSRRHLRTLVRTVAADVSQRAREATYQKSNIVKGVKWVSTLDARTTDICAGLDGKEFKPGEGIRPPAHPNCRSTTVPVLMSWEEMGIPGVRELTPSQRAQMPGSRGRFTEEQTYGQFLKRQSVQFQNEVLGKARAEMFRSGQVQIDEFVDYSRIRPRSFTVETLRKRHKLDVAPSQN